MKIFQLFLGGIVVASFLYSFAGESVALSKEKPDADNLNIVHQCVLTAERLSQKMEATGKRRIFVADYGDISGRVNSLGRLASEILSGSLADSNSKFTVVDRRHLSELLKERKKVVTGLFSSGSIGKIGEFIGADVVIVGTIAPVADVVYFLSKGIDVKSGQIVFSDSMVLARSNTTDQMLRTGISGHDIFRNMPETARFHNIRTFTPDLTTVACPGYGVFRSEAHAKAKYCYQRPDNQRPSLTCYRHSGDGKPDEFTMRRFCLDDNQGNRILDTARLAEMGINL